MTMPWPSAARSTAASPVATPARAASEGISCSVPSADTAATRSSPARTARSASSSRATAGGGGGGGPPLPGPAPRRAPRDPPPRAPRPPRAAPPRAGGPPPRHARVADDLLDRPAVALHDPPGRLEVPGEELPNVLRVA